MADFLSRENELLGDEFSTPTGGTFATASGDDIDFDLAASAFPDISLDGDIPVPSAPPVAQTSSSGGFSFDDFDSPPLERTTEVKVTGDDEIEKFENEFPEIEMPSEQQTFSPPTQSTFGATPTFAPRPQPRGFTPILNHQVEEEEVSETAITVRRNTHLSSERSVDVRRICHGGIRTYNDMRSPTSIPPIKNALPVANVSTILTFALRKRNELFGGHGITMRRAHVQSVCHTPLGAQGANTGMQDGYNLGWKIALVYKGLAHPSLLDSYNEERVPVARAVLDRTTAYAKDAIKSRAAAPSIFRQLGVNYRWSSIVVDDQGESSTGVEMAAYLPEENTELRAGDRAPDASALKPVTRSGGVAKTLVSILKPGAKTNEESRTLFSIFKPTHHTVLLLDPPADETQAIFSSLGATPKGTFRTVVILPSEHTKDESSFSGADEVLVDTDGHAFTAYHPVKQGFRVFVVRPDGVLGAVVKGNAGVGRYVEAVFKQPSKN